MSRQCRSGRAVPDCQCGASATTTATKKATTATADPGRQLLGGAAKGAAWFHRGQDQTAPTAAFFA